MLTDEEFAKAIGLKLPTSSKSYGCDHEARPASKPNKICSRCETNPVDATSAVKMCAGCTKAISRSIMRD